MVVGISKTTLAYDEGRKKYKRKEKINEEIIYSIFGNGAIGRSFDRFICGDFGKRA